MIATSTGQRRREVSGQAAIDLQGVHKHFGKVRAVRGIDLAITRGGVHMVWVANAVAWLVVFSDGALWRFRKDTARM